MVEFKKGNCMKTESRILFSVLLILALGVVAHGAGQSQQVSFTVSGLDYGQYEVEVAGLSDEFTASRSITWWLILIIVVAVGLIIWGVVWGTRRRRKAQQEA